MRRIIPYRGSKKGPLFRAKLRHLFFLPCLVTSPRRWRRVIRNVGKSVSHLRVLSLNDLNKTYEFSGAIRCVAEDVCEPGEDESRGQEANSCYLIGLLYPGYEPECPQQLESEV